MLSINCEGSLTTALPLNIHVNASFPPPPQVDVPTASAVEAEASVEPSDTERSVPVAAAVVQESTKVYFRRPHDQV